MSRLEHVRLYVPPENLPWFYLRIAMEGRTRRSATVLRGMAPVRDPGPTTRSLTRSSNPVRRIKGERIEPRLPQNVSKPSRHPCRQLHRIMFEKGANCPWCHDTVELQRTRWLNRRCKATILHNLLVGRECPWCNKRITPPVVHKVVTKPKAAAVQQEPLQVLKRVPEGPTGDRRREQRLRNLARRKKEKKVHRQKMAKVLKTLRIRGRNADKVRQSRVLPLRALTECEDIQSGDAPNLPRYLRARNACRTLVEQGFPTDSIAFAVNQLFPELPGQWKKYGINPYLPVELGGGGLVGQKPEVLGEREKKLYAVLASRLGDSERLAKNFSKLWRPYNDERLLGKMMADFGLEPRYPNRVLGALSPKYLNEKVRGHLDDVRTLLLQGIRASGPFKSAVLPRYLPLPVMAKKIREERRSILSKYSQELQLSQTLPLAKALEGIRKSAEGAYVIDQGRTPTDKSYGLDWSVRFGSKQREDTLEVWGIIPEVADVQEVVYTRCGPVQAKLDLATATPEQITLALIAPW